MRWGSKVQWSKHPILLGYTDFVQGRHVNVSDIYRPDLDSNIGMMSTVFFFDECVSEYLKEEVVYC